MQEKSLEGISFGFDAYDNTTLGDPTVDSLQEKIIVNNLKLRNYVQELGGIIVASEASDYRLNNPTNFRRHLRAMASNIPAIPRLQEQPFSDMSNQDIEILKQEVDTGSPRLFAYREKDRGHGKYLIETSEQIGKIAQLGKEYLADTGKRLYDNFVVRPFIQTPSNHFTSYRVVATAAGKVQSAGLLYSGHNKDGDRRIIRACQATADPLLVFMSSNFENPDSPYFLNARDVRSNILCGGHMIPLMGDDRRPLAPGEATILEAHGLDPHRPELPADLLAHAQTIGSMLAPKADLVLGVDFIQDQDEQRYLLEINLGPGGRAYIDCHLGGKADMNDAMYLARLEVIDDIAQLPMGRPGHP